MFSFLFFTLQGKPQTLAVKRKAESEEERDEVSTLSSIIPAKTSPVVESPKAMEEKGGLGGEEQTSAGLPECTEIRGKLLSGLRVQSDSLECGPELGG